jgi:hypothetical protein
MGIRAKLKGYKTTIFNTIVAALGVVTAVNPDANLPTGEEVGSVIQNVEGLYIVGAAVLNQILRLFTNTPIFNKKHS